MRAKIWFLIIAVLTFLTNSAAVPVYADAANRVRESAAVIKEITTIPEATIPPVLFKDAAGIAIIPGVIKAGVVFAGRFGTGVLMVREDNGSWSLPAFVNMGGGSVGWQIGAQSTDFILVFKNKRSIDGIVNGKFTAGVDASVAAGPVGRNLEVSTDQLLKAEIYSYSRSRGLFAGLSLEGAILHIDNEAAAEFYKRPNITAREIFSGKAGSSDPDVAALRHLLAKHASGGK
jgi:lipid-binding SYLF domain-containing protein